MSDLDAIRITWGLPIVYAIGFFIAMWRFKDDPKWVSLAMMIVGFLLIIIQLGRILEVLERIYSLLLMYPASY